MMRRFVNWFKIKFLGYVRISDYVKIEVNLQPAAKQLRCSHLSLVFKDQCHLFAGHKGAHDYDPEGF